jgi:hypothetical protein
LLCARIAAIKRAIADGLIAGEGGKSIGPPEVVPLDETTKRIDGPSDQQPTGGQELCAQAA